MELSLLVASSLIAACSIWLSKRGHPLWAVDPRGLMALVLWVNAAGFIIYRLARGAYPTVFGFDERHALEAGALLASAQAGFLLGTLVRIPSRGQHAPRSPEPITRVTPLIGVLSAAVLITGAFQYAKLIALGGAAILSGRYGEAQYEMSTAPAILNAAYICVPTLLLLIVAWAHSRRSLFNASLLGIIAYAMAPALILGVRRDVILCGFALILGHAIRAGRTRLRNVVVIGLFAVGSSYALGLSRSGASLAFGDRMAALSERATGGDDPLDLRTVTTTSGVPILTAAISVFPARSPYTAGRTYVESLVNAAFPRFLTGGHVFKPPALGFKDLFYADVTNHGMDYSLSAEAYQNFGVIGPFVAALCLGVLLQFTFRRAVAGSLRWLLLHFQVIAAAFWAIRSDSNVTMKLTLYGAVWVLLLFAAARSLSPRSHATRLLPGVYTRCSVARGASARAIQTDNGGR